MNSNQFITRLGAACLSAAFLQSAAADVLELTEKEDWIELVGEFVTIGFTEYPNNTFITDQYAHLGVIFTDGNDNISCCSKSTYPEDGAGLDGNLAIDLVFNTPQTYIAVDHPGTVQFELFSKGSLIYTSSSMGGGGAGFFSGIISTQQFDTAVLSQDHKDSQVFLDDLHFGYGIPGDLNHDDIVGFEDLLIVLSDYGECPEQVDPCPGDVNNNNVVDLSDMLTVLETWGFCDDCDNPDGCPTDIDDDCFVGMSDLLVVIGSFGSCPDANYITCPSDITFDGVVDTDDIQLILNNWGQ